MTDNPSFKIRPIVPDDLDQAMGLSKAEGWNQTEDDWKLFMGNPLNTCLVAEFNHKVAGTATAFCYSDKVAWIGMVLVDKNLRGKGAGKMLLTNIIESLKHIDSIKLDATPEGQPLYHKLGFTEEHKIFRMTNTSLNNCLNKKPLIEPGHIDRECLPEVIKLDSRIFGTDRTYLLQTLLQNYPKKAFLLNRDLKPDGFIFGRDGERFNYIGPVSAYSSDSAKMLIEMALLSLKNKPVALDIMEDKEDLIRWLESTGFVKQRHFTRMFLKSNSYKGILKNQYLICGPEFG
ncbi:MAG: GNAT family N-acetyltransferase [Bacteroidales bacterium]|nr:GNAT family N-acetyltransferase [Bacteroidales bacterium]